MYSYMAITRRNIPPSKRMLILGGDIIGLEMGTVYSTLGARAFPEGIAGQPMLAHKAVHEAHVAAEVIAGELQGNKELASAAFNARVIPSKRKATASSRAAAWSASKRAT